MKRLLAILLALLSLMTPVLASAAGSRENISIPVTTTVTVVPEDDTKDVIPPTVTIVPDTEEVEEIQEDVQNVFHLIIHYVYSDGTVAEEPIDIVLQVDESYNIVVPEIPGFNVTLPSLEGDMPMRDVEFTIVYMSDEDENTAFQYKKMRELFNMDDYETPLGLGFSMSNVGVCFE